MNLDDEVTWSARHFGVPWRMTSKIVEYQRPDQFVDEMIFSFTHTREIPWMLPGVPPTNRRVEVPLVAIVRFRGDKLAHEHIYWDQASVLRQIGLLPGASLPVFGAETAHKVLDPKLPANQLMARVTPHPM